MTQPDRVIASVEVKVDPETAFRIFTEEIDAWWERGPHNFYDGGRAVAKRFEPRIGGRYLEVYDDATGDAFEIGRITSWEPGRRFVYRSTRDDTEVETRFEAIPGGTRVTVEQRLVGGGKTAYFLSGWHNILAWFAERADRPDRGPVTPKDLPRVCPVLYYNDVATAEDWLVRIFGMQRRHRGWGVGELRLGDSILMLNEFKGADGNSKAVTHALYVYVDDLKAHFEQAQAGGAHIIGGLQKHGDRFYIAEDLEGHRWTFAQARPTQR